MIGIYDGFKHRYLEYPELSLYLNGTVVDALNATEMVTFTLEAEGEIEAYDVSVRGDRIALVRDETVIELWNPLTEEQLTMLDVPPLPIMDSC